jgi:uncharacterized protein YggE
MRNKILWSILAIFTILGMVFGLSSLNGARAASNAQATEPTPLPDGTTNAPMRTISVNGTGNISLNPDIATISIGVHTENKDAQQAVSDNNAQAQQVTSALTAAGIAAKDIQTSNFSITPRQEYDNNGTVTGVTYVVDNNVQVTVRNLANLGSVLDSVVQAGANNINGIQFSVEDPTDAYNAALQAAVNDAHSRAEALAQAAGVELGAVQTITSTISGGPTPVFRELAAAPSAVAEVPISPGQTQITVDVGVVYAIR